MINRSNSVTVSNNITYQQHTKPSDEKELLQMDLTKRSFSLSSYYKRRFSALVSGNHGEYGLTNSKQDEAVAFWRSTVAQIEAPYSSAVLDTEQKDSPPPITPYQQLCSITPIGKNSNRAVCKFILRELYATETSYHHLLKFIYCKYMQPMNIALQEQNNPLFTRQSSTDVVTLFAHLPQLLQLSEHLIPSLEQAMAIQDTKGAARAFISLREQLVIFLRYTIHYQSNFRFIRKMCQTNPMLLHIQRECLSHHDTRRMSIADYLIAPIQRVPRYCLLLQDLLKHTPPYDQSHPVLKKSVALVTSLADTMNLYSI
ncbi:Dbl homology domain-containing protein [Lichtheimia hyalospora FSU 10163]|nr:Dbl homology domain-containing protein [Lichtheimia hyalospora FSU 10163]